MTLSVDRLTDGSGLEALVSTIVITDLILHLHYDQTTPAINTSENVSSVTDQNAGDFDINLTSAMSAMDSFYCGPSARSSLFSSVWAAGLSLQNMTVSVVPMHTASTTPTDVDYPNDIMIGWGEFA